MATATQTPSEPSVRDLVSGILQDAETLISQQLEMFKAEIRADLEKTAQATSLFGAGLAVCLVGVILLGFTAVYLLALTGLPLVACFAIVTGVTLVIGIGLVVWAIQLFRSFNPLPDESVAALEENVECLTHPAKTATGAYP